MPTKDDVIFPSCVNRDEIDEVLYTPDMIQSRVRDLGVEISNFYDDDWRVRSTMVEGGEGGGRIETPTSTSASTNIILPSPPPLSSSSSRRRLPLIVVCTLRGAVPFFADLVRCLTVEAEWEFVALSSYGDGTDSSGCVETLLDIRIDVSDRDVLIVEDILDTGHTLRYLIDALRARGPNSVRTAVLLHKTERTIGSLGLVPEFVGYVIPNAFVVGYGLDYAQRYRCLPWIGVLAPWVYNG